MSKIKLLILLLFSITLINCSNSNNQNINKSKFKVSYIGGGYDGLVLKKLLLANLQSFNPMVKCL